MEVRIIKGKITVDELKKIAQEGYKDMVKAVVDVEKAIMAVGAAFHSEEAEMLFEQGSKTENLWGVNIYPGKPASDCLEFNSLINIKPAINNRSMDIKNLEIKEEIKKIVEDLIIWS